MSLEDRVTLRPAETAEMLGMSLRWLQQHTEPHGPIPCIRVGRAVLYSRVEVLAWLEAQRVRKGVDHE